MEPEEFNQKISEIHEKLNDAFIAVQGLHTAEMDEMAKKHHITGLIVGIRQDLDAMGLRPY